MPSAPTDNLCEPSELTRYGVPGSFVAQFPPRPMQVKIDTGGALGTMQFVYKLAAEDNYNNTPIASSTATTPWTIELDEQVNLYASLSFAAATYVTNDVYFINEVGTVTQTTGTAGGLTATRYDLRTTACSSVTREALMLMQNAVTAPLTAWTDDARTHAAAMVYAILKRGRGFTAQPAGVGDENILAAEAMARAYFINIGEKGKPAGWTDSSVTDDGPIFSSYPSGNTPRGWADGW